MVVVNSLYRKRAIFAPPTADNQAVLSTFPLTFPLSFTFDAFILAKNKRRVKRLYNAHLTNHLGFVIMLSFPITITGGDREDFWHDLQPPTFDQTGR